MTDSKIITKPVIRAYKVKHNSEKIRNLVEWFTKAVQRAIDLIWDNVEWKLDLKNKYKYGRVKLKVPVIPKSSDFRKALREEIRRNSPYASHWTKEAIRVAYNIVENWRKRYLKGKAKKAKPKVKRKFARCPVTLMKINYEERKIRITVSKGEHELISWKSQWFTNRVKDCKVKELILKENEVIIPFEKEVAFIIEDYIAWDCNELTIDGFSPSIGFVRIDLRDLISKRIVFQEKRRRIQELMKKKPRVAKRLWKKYNKREKNFARDYERKLATLVVRTFPSYGHVFEDLSKEAMIRKSNKNLRKRLSRASWISIIKEMENRGVVSFVSPKLTSRTCSRCGWINKDLRGQVFVCKRCGLVIDRQKNAAVNIYLKMWGFSRSYEWWERTVKPLLNHELWVRLPRKGVSPMICSPMKGELRMMSSKCYVDECIDVST